MVRLSVLERETSIDSAREGTGFLGMVKAVDGRESMGSDLDFVNAGGGNVRPALLSQIASSNSGSGRSSLPKLCILSVRGRKPRSLGGCTLLKSYGALIEPTVDRRVRLVVELPQLDAIEARVFPSASHCEGREDRDAGRILSKSKVGGLAGLGCSQQICLYLSKPSPISGCSS